MKILKKETHAVSLSSFLGLLVIKIFFSLKISGLSYFSVMKTRKFLIRTLSLAVLSSVKCISATLWVRSSLAVHSRSFLDVDWTIIWTFSFAVLRSYAAIWQEFRPSMPHVAGRRCHSQEVPGWGWTVVISFQIRKRSDKINMSGRFSVRSECSKEVPPREWGGGTRQNLFSIGSFSFAVLRKLCFLQNCFLQNWKLHIVTDIKFRSPCYGHCVSFKSVFPSKMLDGRTDGRSDLKGISGRRCHSHLLLGGGITHSDWY